MKRLWILGLCLAFGCNTEERSMDKIKFMTLDPGHFHAALVQKSSYPEVDTVSYLYAPEGSEVQDYLAKINQYNSRSENPTNWQVQKYLGAGFHEKMLEESPGNVMVVAGKNDRKIDYILKAVENDVNVYADKPMVINAEGLVKLEQAFQIAKEKDLLLYDIMTERFEITTMLQKRLSQSEKVFGTLVDGTIENPAISKESIHHFFKYVSGKPLQRPGWFFDTRLEGEGIVDVTTHLVDLIQWEAFPDQVIQKSDIDMLQAKRWPTPLSLEKYKEVTQLDEFPDYLSDKVENGILDVYSNGEMNYTIKGKHAKVSVIWNYRAPEGTADTHFSKMRGTKSDLIIKQGAEENFKTVLYVKSNSDGKAFEESLKSEIALISQDFPGLAVEATERGFWKVIIPEKYKEGHEAHFARVTEKYIDFWKGQPMPDWEIPNMITKYHTNILALELAKSTK